MAEKEQGGAVDLQIDPEKAEVQEQQEKKEQQGISPEDVRVMIEDERKKWQSRFDQILAEKKAEENKAMTVEQRIEQLERERQQERLEWSRKEAKASAQIDDELEQAVRAYASDEPTKIAEGAKEIRRLIDSAVQEYKTKIEELEKQLKYGGKTPVGGGKPSKGLESMTATEIMDYARQGESQRQEVIAFQRTKKIGA
jgi:formate dehydrogenase maturation protein FdhE